MQRKHIPGWPPGRWVVLSHSRMDVPHRALFGTDNIVTATSWCATGFAAFDRALGKVLHDPCSFRAGPARA